MFAGPLAAQDQGEMKQLDRRLGQLVGRSFDDFIWSNVSVYQLKDHYLQRLTSVLDAENDADLIALGESMGGSGDPKVFAEMMIQIVQMPQASRGIEAIKGLVAQKYGIDPEDIDESLLSDAVARARVIVQRRHARPTEFYLVTSKVSSSESPRLIALIGTMREETTNERVIRMVKAGTDLYAFLGSGPADSGTPSK